ncbi:MAG: hypothetical protein M3Q07_12275 [Pseudobdellovibrionaceae bacterium]|nr:hypothetical protein [Pseudobdellovibrionaceae bacterium]
MDRMDRAEFDSINKRLLSDAKTWLPGFQSHGDHYLALNPTRDDKTVGSFVISKDGKGYDFASNQSLDLIDCWASVHRTTVADALEQLKGSSTPKSSAKKNFHSSEPLKPKTALNQSANDPMNLPPVKDFKHFRLGNPSKIYAYRDFDGSLLGYTCRFESLDDKGNKLKDILPLTFSDRAWKFNLKGLAEKAPAYGKDRLNGRDSSKAIVVEGEKTADAAQSLVPNIPALTWLGGVSKAKHADFSFLEGRTVYLIPDADQHAFKQGEEGFDPADPERIKPLHLQPGYQAMLAIGKGLPESCTILCVMPPAGVPDGWDLADIQDSHPDEVREFIETSAIPFSDYCRLVAPAAEDTAPVAPAAEDTVPAAKAPEPKKTEFRKLSVTPLELARKVRAFTEGAADPELEPFREAIADAAFSASVLAAALRTINHYQYLKESTLTEALTHVGFPESKAGKKGKRSRTDEPFRTEDILNVIENVLGYKLTWNEVLNKLEVNGTPIDSRTRNTILEACRMIAPEFATELERPRVVLQAIESLAVRSYHPFRDYFRSCKDRFLESKADGSRLMDELMEHIKFANDEDKAWFRQCFEFWLIGHASRVFNPAFQNPVLTLIGTQGIGKGTFCRSLSKNVAKRYFREQRVNPDNKDHYIAMTQTFLWEIGELGGTTTRVDVNALKCFLTTPTVNIRLPYDRSESELVPTASFIATANEQHILTDPSGNRRFLCTHPEEFDYRFFQDIFDPDILWGWAMIEAEKANFHPSMSEDMVQKRAATNEEHRITDPLESMVDNLFDFDVKPDTFVPNSAVVMRLQQTRGFESIATNQAAWRRLHQALERAGIKSIQRLYKGRNTRGFRGVALKSFADIANETAAHDQPAA